LLTTLVRFNESCGTLEKNEKKSPIVVHNTYK
jgi:hypothetical protein